MQSSSKKLVYNEVKEISFLDELIQWSKNKSLYYWIIIICSWLSIGLAFYHLFVAVYGTPEGRSFRSVHLSVMMILAVFIYPVFRKSINDKIILPNDEKGNFLRLLGSIYDLLIIISIIFVQLWTTWDVETFMMRYGDKYIGDIIVGSILIFLVLDGTRRAVGWAMVFVAGFFMLHALYAHKFFGFFYGPPTRLAKYIDTLFMTSDGIYGIPLYVASTYIVLFIIFGAILIRSGVGRFFVDLAISLTGHRTGGPAKAAVVASGMTGTVYGSAVANVVTTGSFTIPLMKNYGYRPRFAAAVEACASSGGQITPPIMGAAAFIMAEFLEAPYSYVILAAIIPAFLYFVTIYFMVHVEAEKHGIEKIDKSMLPNVIDVLKSGWHMLLSLVVLIALLIYGYTAMKAGFWAIISVIFLSFFKSNTRMSVVDLLGAFESGIKSTVPVTIACMRWYNYRISFCVRFRTEIHSISHRLIWWNAISIIMSNSDFSYNLRYGNDYYSSLHNSCCFNCSFFNTSWCDTNCCTHVCFLFWSCFNYYTSCCFSLICWCCNSKITSYGYSS